MKRLWVLTVLAFLAVSTVHAGEKHLFILSGQSNMKRMNEKLTFVPAVEKEFGKANVIVVKDAQGAQPIARWYKKDGSKGALYVKLMAKVNAAIKGQKIKTVTFLWMQGERDAKSKLGASYAASLRALIDMLIKDLGRKDLNFVIGRISDHGNKRFPDWLVVREAHVKVAEADPRGEWIDTDDCNDGKQGKKVLKNDLHMSLEGYKTMGTRFAEKAIELIKKAN